MVCLASDPISESSRDYIIDIQRQVARVLFYLPVGISAMSVSVRRFSISGHVISRRGISRSAIIMAFPPRLHFAGHSGIPVDTPRALLPGKPTMMDVNNQQRKWDRGKGRAQ